MSLNKLFHIGSAGICIRWNNHIVHNLDIQDQTRSDQGGSVQSSKGRERSERERGHEMEQQQKHGVLYFIS